MSDTHYIKIIARNIILSKDDTLQSGITPIQGASDENCNFLQLMHIQILVMGYGHTSCPLRKSAQKRVIVLPKILRHLY